MNDAYLRRRTVVMEQESGLFPLFHPVPGIYSIESWVRRSTNQSVEGETVLVARPTALDSLSFEEVDVPRFELGASTMPR